MWWNLSGGIQWNKLSLIVQEMFFAILKVTSFPRQLTVLSHISSKSWPLVGLVECVSSPVFWKRSLWIIMFPWHFSPVMSMVRTHNTHVKHVLKLWAGCALCKPSFEMPSHCKVISFVRCHTFLIIITGLVISTCIALSEPSWGG